MMRGGGGFGGDNRKPYNLNLSVNFNNLFNTVNYSTPVGNLSSGRFGEYTSTSGGFGGFGGFGGYSLFRVASHVGAGWQFTPGPTARS